MQKLLLLIFIAMTLALFAYANRLSAGALWTPELSSQEAKMTERKVEPIRGKKVRWTFTDGPMAGIPIEHTFNEDGTVVWRIIGGSMKGASAQEKEYAAVKITDNVYAVSYLAASGHTLTVVLNFETKRMNGFASDDKQWQAMSGTFEVLK
jgi:hypothetical protein